MHPVLIWLPAAQRYLTQYGEPPVINCSYLPSAVLVVFTGILRAVQAWSLDYSRLLYAVDMTLDTAELGTTLPRSRKRSVAWSRIALFTQAPRRRAVQRINLMSIFTFFGKSVELPATRLLDQAITRDQSAWHVGTYITVRLTDRLSALRVHTSGRRRPCRRPASSETGAWILIGDVIQTSTDLANTRSLPTNRPQSMVAFTHTSMAHVAATTVLNIGLTSAKFGGTGSGFQAEYVSGPHIQFTPIHNKHWHGGIGHA